uniref:Uncharacterized protein n=1 Tax=Acrobeloides nanus TaxID=290746 RepID=A0A914CLU6_9BILA
MFSSWSKFALLSFVLLFLVRKSEAQQGCIAPSCGNYTAQVSTCCQERDNCLQNGQEDSNACRGRFCSCVGMLLRQIFQTMNPQDALTCKMETVQLCRQQWQ